MSEDHDKDAIDAQHATRFGKSASHFSLVERLCLDLIVAVSGSMLDDLC